jgi:hypothetical protein
MVYWAGKCWVSFIFTLLIFGIDRIHLQIVQAFKAIYYEQIGDFFFYFSNTVYLWLYLNTTDINQL